MLDNIYTVKPAYLNTSIKQSPVLKGLFFFLSWYRKYELNLLKRLPVLKGHFFFVRKVTSKHRLDCIY